MIVWETPQVFRVVGDADYTDADYSDAETGSAAIGKMVGAKGGMGIMNARLLGWLRALRLHAPDIPCIGDVVGAEDLRLLILPKASCDRISARVHPMFCTPSSTAKMFGIQVVGHETCVADAPDLGAPDRALHEDDEVFSAAVEMVIQKKSTSSAKSKPRRSSWLEETRTRCQLYSSASSSFNAAWFQKRWRK